MRKIYNTSWVRLDEGKYTIKIEEREIVGETEFSYDVRDELGRIGNVSKRDLKNIPNKHRPTLSFTEATELGIQIFKDTIEMHEQIVEGMIAGMRDYKKKYSLL